ncbi:MAG: hypothetical protein KBD21_05645, partial [Candidatus Pacebacteria bacterium]|nr:hypothetical protein [Candidatus Paceibacterota bacterium]
AARIMRVLAVTGLVSVLAIVAWMVVQGVRYVPNASERITAMVTSITSVFRSAPEESVRFNLPTRSLEAYEETTLAWDYDGPALGNNADLSFSCDASVRLRLRSEGVWKEPSCNEWVPVGTSSVEVIPLSPDSRYADIEITVRLGSVTDNTVLTVVNTAPTSSSTSAVATTTNATSTPVASIPTTVSPTLSVPQKTIPSVQPVRVLTASDLAINIEATGVYIDVAKKRTFFPISPIPSDKRAGVVFTVTNRGETASNIWAFTVHVPTADDPSYKYTSPLQEPLKPGMQVEFTLGFDEVPEKGKGTIRVELTTPDKNDASGNNTDVASVTFK